MRIKKQCKYFFFRPVLFVRSVRKRSEVFPLMLISVVIQTLIASVPALMSSIPRSAGFYLGLLMIFSISLPVKTAASALIIKLFIDRTDSNGEKMSFRVSMNISLYCQMILLLGKIAAVCVSLLQYTMGIVDTFSVIRFIDLARFVEMIGWTVPESIGRADIFTVIFIAVLARILRSRDDIPMSVATAGTLANWLVLGAVQRLVIELPRMVWS